MKCQVGALLFVALLCWSVGTNAFEEDDDETFEFVTYGSSIKLAHVGINCRLHSHEVNYGNQDGSSGQQSVTCFPGSDDPNSLWIVKAPTGKPTPKGEVVKKGDVIRLQHVKTKLNLHAHNHKSPLTKQTEVSCYGPNGVGDSGDHWVFDIVTGKYWVRGEPFRLKHKDTGAYLSSHAQAKFGHPISGQFEVAGSKEGGTTTYWSTADGFYVAADTSKIDL